jgi:hypothetical protein
MSETDPTRSDEEPSSDAGEEPAEKDLPGTPDERAEGLVDGVAEGE